ncbi:MAG: asparagine synthetase B, partial [Bacteroidetes bacterium]
PPAHSLKLVADSKSMLVQQYWDIERAEVYEGSVGDAVEKFRELFLTSVKRRLRSDVSLGTSLSGGLDSSSIVAAINGVSGLLNGHNCFSASFPGFDKDESTFAKKVTDQFALTGNFAKPSAEGFIEDFKKLCFHHESPFGSSSVYAQYKVFELAKEKGVKVLLDGQGADEMLAGYQKYIHWWLQELLFKRKFLSYRKEKKAFELNKVKWNWNVKNRIAAFVPGMTALELQSRASKKLKRIPGISQAFLHAYYDFDFCNKPIVRELNDILYYNTLQFGLEELLIYADRNSMAHGREVRLPFLNHELVEFVFSLQSSYKMKDGYTKWILRESIKKELPAEITWRTDKIGFEPPQNEWMNHPSLRDLVLESRKKLITAGILKKDLLQNPVIPQAAFAEDNYDWRYLVAGTLISI